jgi:hypothetical protein
MFSVSKQEVVMALVKVSGIEQTASDLRALADKAAADIGRNLVMARLHERRRKAKDAQLLRELYRTEDATAIVALVREWRERNWTGVEHDEAEQELLRIAQQRNIR